MENILTPIFGGEKPLKSKDEKDMQALDKLTDLRIKLLNPLLNGTVDGFVFDKSGYCGLKIGTKNGKTKIIWFLRDEEANGPGSFDITDE